MRAVACVVLIFALACTRAASTGGAGQSGGTADAGSPPSADAGAVSDDGGTNDAGTPSDDAGVTDAGFAPDAGPGDAGPPATIGAVDCPQSPPLLWSRTIADSFDFRIAADQNGNLYWIEYDSVPRWFLVSADSDGRDRYRVALPGTEAARAFVVSSGKVLLSQGTTIEGYDAATGAPAWTLDMKAAYPGSSAVSGYVDLGNGDVAMSLNSGLYFIDIGSGKVIWSQAGPKDGYSTLTSNGAGSIVVSADAVGSAADYFVLDSTGAQKWRQRIDGATGTAPWLSDVPWLPMASAGGISPSNRYVAVPSSWFGWVGGTDLAFSVFSGSAALAPITVQAIRHQVVVAAGPVPKEISFNPFAAWPFLAGNDGSHLLLVGQSWHGSPGLCFPEAPSEPWVARIDDSFITQCALAVPRGILALFAAALIPGRLIVGAVDMINYGCGGPANPMVIAAYAVPGESLAPSGWVQKEGNPGLGSRRQTP